jgi:hypothetical protein
MKKTRLIPIIIVFLCLLVAVSLVAQEGEKKEFNTKKTQFNIAVVNIFSKSNIGYYVDQNGNMNYTNLQLYPATKLLLGMKFHNDKGATRLGVTLHYNTTKNTNDNGSESKFRDLETGFYVGYEWHSTFNRVNVYYGFDLSASYYIWKRIYSSESRDEEDKTRTYTFGIHPLVGVNYFITPYLSIGTEAKLMLQYANGKAEFHPQFPDADIRVNTYQDFEVRFGPLGFLSINIHF